MSYKYENYRAGAMEDIDRIIDVWDEAKRLDKLAGAFTLEHLMLGTGCSFTMLARIDYLIETGRIEKVFDGGAAQHHVLRVCP